MSHGGSLHIDVDRVIEAGPVTVMNSGNKIAKTLIVIGLIAVVFGLSTCETKHFWGVFYVNVVYWLGLGCGAVLTSAIFQIVRAQWSPPVRRVSEAHINFIPWMIFLLLVSYFGKESLFPWANAPMPGREWWMQENFVYFRFLILFALLFFVMWRFVGLSLKSDAGLLKDKEKEIPKSLLFPNLTASWQGAEKEALPIQCKLSFWAPVLVIVYAVVYSLFAFEMVMSMDTIWYSNMFGGFFFIGNIYLGWCMIYIISANLSRKSKDFSKVISSQTFSDLGRLLFGFCMLWGYLFFSQYLPQWYGNLPEETAWMIKRTRGIWMPISYLTFGLSFVIPFILFLSRDVKRNPSVGIIACLIALVGVFFEKYVIIMPQLFEKSLPFISNLGFLEIGLTCGFIGLYYLCISSFLSKYPYVPISHPLTYGSTDW